MPVVLDLDGQHPKCKIPGDAWRISIDSEGRQDVSGYWDLSYQPGPLQWDELSKLKKLSDLTYSGPDTTVVDYLCSKKCSVRQFTWQKNEQSRFDFSAAPRLNNLGLDIDCGSVHLRLPTHGQFEELRLLQPRKNCKATVVCPDKGCGVRLMFFGGSLIAVPGLKQIDTLQMFEAVHVDVAAVVRAYPKLRRLSIGGKSVSLKNVDSLAKLKHLHSFEIRECYSMKASEFPDAAKFSALASVDFRGLRADDAKVIAEKFKGIDDLSISGKRTDEWIAKNVGNPFNNWGDSFGASVGKKAMDAWKAASTEICKLPKSASRIKARAILKTFVEVFNKLDAGSGLETDQREQIYDEFTTLAARLPDGMVTDEDYYDWAEYS